MSESEHNWLYWAIGAVVIVLAGMGVHAARAPRVESAR